MPKCLTHHGHMNQNNEDNRHKVRLKYVFNWLGSEYNQRMQHLNIDILVIGEGRWPVCPDSMWMMNTKYIVLDKITRTVQTEYNCYQGS